jgi:hypothetical protein
LILFQKSHSHLHPILPKTLAAEQFLAKRYVFDGTATGFKMSSTTLPRAFRCLRRRCRGLSGVSDGAAAGFKNLSRRKVLKNLQRLLLARSARFLHHLAAYAPLPYLIKALSKNQAPSSQR